MQGRADHPPHALKIVLVASVVRRHVPDFLSIRVYLGDETSRSMGLAY